MPRQNFARKRIALLRDLPFVVKAPSNITQALLCIAEAPNTRTCPALLLALPHIRHRKVTCVQRPGVLKRAPPTTGGGGGGAKVAVTVTLDLPT